MKKRRRQSNKVLLDSNLAVLFCAGISGPENIGRHKRLQEYDETDFEILKDFLGKSPDLVFSPYVLSETSNLLRHAPTPLRDTLSAVLRMLLGRASERHIEGAEIVEEPAYFRLGMTDSALLAILRKNPELQLLTADLDLYLTALALGQNAVNFSHIRDRRPDFR